MVAGMPLLETHGIFSRYRPHFRKKGKLRLPGSRAQSAMRTPHFTLYENFQATLRNTFFRMRRDDSTRKNSCQAKNLQLQSNQYALAERTGEGLQT